MSQSDRAWARCVRGLMIVAIWFLVIEAIDPTAERVALDRGIRGVGAILLAMGLFPGSYLDRLIRRWSTRAAEATVPAFWAIALGVPLLLLTASLVLVVISWQILGSIPPEASNAPTWWSIIHNAGMGVIALTLLIPLASLRRPPKGE